jgi:hypothetical protein
MANALPLFEKGASYPTSGTYQTNQVVMNEAASEPGDAVLWYCKTGSASGGTWVKAATVTDLGITTVTAAAALTAGYTHYHITAAGNYTLAAASGYANGYKICISTTGAVTLVAGSSNTLVGNNTIAANTAMQWTCDGAAYWLRAS